MAFSLGFGSSKSKSSAESGPLSDYQQGSRFSSALASIFPTDVEIQRDYSPEEMERARARAAAGGKKGEHGRAEVEALNNRAITNQDEIEAAARQQLTGLGTYQAPNYVDPGQAMRSRVMDSGPAQTSDVVGAGSARASEIYDSGDAATSRVMDAGRVKTSGIYDQGAAKTSAVGQLQDASQLAGGDYDRLEQNILQSRTAPLEYAQKKAAEAANESAAKRGIWSSGLAVRAENDVAERFAPELRAAAGEAATQRYGLEAQDLNNANNYNLNRFATTNSANLGQDTMLNSYNADRAKTLNDATQSRDAMTNSYNLNRASNLNSANLGQNSMLNTFNTNRASNLNSATGAQDSMLNNFALNSAKNLNDANLGNNSMINSFNTSRASNLNSANLGQNTMLNSFNVSRANTANDFNMNNADRNFQAAWKPVDFLAGLYGGSGGQTSKSNGSSSAFNASLSGGSK